MKPHTRGFTLIDTNRAPTAYNSGSYDWMTWAGYYLPPHNMLLNMVHVDGHVSSLGPMRVWNNQNHVPYFADY